MTSDAELPNNTAIRIAFGRWAMRQAEKEVDQDFARLRAVPHDAPLKLLWVIDQWSPEDRLCMLFARIKNLLNPPPSRPGVPLFELSQREEWAFGQFDYILVQPPVMIEIAARRARGDFSLPKGALKQAMKSKLKSLLGKPAQDDYGELTYITQVAGVTVYTDVDFGSRSCQVRYSQRLLPRLCNEIISLITREEALFSVSLMNLAGFGETRWSFLTPDEIPSAADLLGQSCIEFIEAVPGIINEARLVMM